MLYYESIIRERGFERIAGVDEAGRGPLAGPVVAAAVVLTEQYMIANLADSKLLSARGRSRAATELERNLPSGFWSLAVIGPEEIDRLNILQATHSAMRRALAGLQPRADFVLVDGLPVSDLGCPAQAIVKGDRKSASIAAASILAKVHRDFLMEQWSRRFPGYDFASNKGYGTSRHLQQLRALGPCSLHRRSFAPVARCLSGGDRQLKFKLTDSADAT